MQYMCSDSSPTADQTLVIRDGTTTNTITTDVNPNDGTNYYNYALNGTFLYGMNEPYSNYASCNARQRNLGLFTADQNLGNTAMSTRQNPGATRYGFECTEERDYYPYWHPSNWKDVAVLVTDTSMCGYYQSQSQNVLGKGYCSGTNSAQQAANNPADCTRANGQWVVQPSWGLSAPDCVAAPFNRDNHLGNTVDGFTNSYNWTLPSASVESCVNGGNCSCVLRLRYNISVGDYNYNADSLLSGHHSPVLGNPTVEAAGYNFTLAVDTQQYGRTFQDRSYMFHIIPRPEGVTQSDKIYNLNVRGKRGNIVQTYPATEYDFVPTFLTVNQDDLIHFQWTGCDTNPAGNTGEGTTSTDRSNIVQITDLSKNYPINSTAMNNVNALFGDPDVRGLMANIGQTGCKSYAQLQQSGNAEQDPANCYKLNAVGPHFDGGLVKMSNLGTFVYMSTRNNNFSNRSQKGVITVNSVWPVWKTVVIVIGGVIAVALGAFAGAFFYAKRNPHSRVAGVMQRIPGIGNKI
jgi:hypothetical protein